MEESGADKKIEQACFIDSPELPFNKMTAEQSNILNSKETDRFAIPNEHHKIEYNETSKENKRALLFFDDFNHMSNIKWIKYADTSDVTTSDGMNANTFDAVHEEKDEDNSIVGKIVIGDTGTEKKSGVDETNNKDILIKNDGKHNSVPLISDLEQRHEEHGCLTFLEIKSRETNRNDKKEMEKIKNSCTQKVTLNDESKGIVSIENNAKSTNINSFQSQKFVKDEIQIPENEFSSGLYVENNVINERLQKEICRLRGDGKYNKQNGNFQLPSVESSSKTKNDILSFVNVKCSENISPNLKNGHVKHRIHSKEFANTYDCISSNLAKLEKVIESEKYQTELFDETKRSASIDLISWEIPDEKTKSGVHGKEKKEILEKDDGKKGKLLGKNSGNITKRDGSYAKIDVTDPGEFEHENKKNIKMKASQLTKNVKLPKNTNSHFYCEDVFLNIPTSNSPKSEINHSNEKSAPGSKSESTYTAAHTVIHQSIQKQEDMCEAGKILDSSKSTNKITELNTKQTLGQDSCEAEKYMHSHNLKKDKSSGNFNMPQKDVGSKKVSKPPRLKRVKPDTMSPKNFMAAVRSEKSEHEKLENDCDSNRKLHNHNTMIFGQCSECVPIQSNETAKEARTTKRMLSKSLLPCVSISDQQTRSKSRSPDRKGTRHLGESEELIKAIEKAVTFADDIRIFSYDPNDSVLETFHNYAQAEEHDDRTEVKIVTENVSASMKGDDANKSLGETCPKMAETIVKDGEKSNNIGDTTTKTVPTRLEIKVLTKATEETLAEVTETPYYDNMGYIADSIPFSALEFELMDSDSISTASDEDLTLVNEKVSLIDNKVKAFPRKYSDLTRQTECKAVRWFKDNSMPFKRLSLKSKKTTSKY